MPLRNRVTPLGELIATPERGLVYGNRGCLLGAAGEICRSWSTRRWISCQLQFKGRRRRPLMAPGRFTELFFLDEATAFAAGHRPCAECRRADYNRLTEIWSSLHPGRRGADAIDAQLHAERLLPGTRGRRFHELAVDELPDGTFVLDRGDPCLVLGDQLLVWSPAGYTATRPLPSREPAAVITPPSLLALLRERWSPLVPLLHPSAAAVSRSR